ncbi:MetQ/NlpA family ABC transporter substrate-binding protein [Arthrobacter sp. VKM Ac-2550]|uniref:MetQ/NlpA family ABC transporter substrate-binding protein n=1 Tax=Crystallibacter permensis TaxID=1938888 RepID=UPI002226B9AC|nr:MetQ/NlpA family ABC transporter substrate-binding protein [Arthrobacter sp. VKM Ac-2550]MCW2132792.1 D-methionine transport system substrate-binding protein [Arthrobacter sp. VKM Ac-2550]
MRKALTLVGTGLAAALALTACGGSDSASNATPDPANPVTVTVGAGPVPHARILEFVDQNLAQDAGIDLEIEEMTDYQTPNIALSDGSIDANYFQHLAFLEQQIEDKGYDFEHGAGIHIEPYAGFSSKHDDVSEIPDGGTIAITNDPANQPRALKMLEEAGLLNGIEEDSAALTLTEEQNPKGLKFEENQPEILLPLIDDPKVDLAIINGNFILEAGMSTDDALVVESVEDNPYANFLTWRAGEKTEAITVLEELLHSPEVKDYIVETWPNGDVTPAF